MYCAASLKGKRKINLENLNFQENGEQLRLLLGPPTRELFFNHFLN